jgi:hypothetical protein
MSRYSRRRKYCRFTAEGIKEIDYAQSLRYRDGQDRSEPYYGDQVSLPAPAGYGGKASSLSRAAAVHRPALVVNISLSDH